MDTRNLKVECKSTQLISILRENLTGKMNLARIKFFGQLICALCKIQNVCFEKLATAFETDAKSSSSLRRIQRFMAEYALNTDLVAQLIFKMLPHKPPYRLAMDRTNWQFGETDINVLTLAVVYQGVAFPILITMLDKRGNSDTQERKEIIKRYIRLFGKETIDCLLADREFVGGNWICSLNSSKIQYYIRIKENFYVQDPRTGKEIKASVMFADLRCGQYRYKHRIYRVNGQLCYIAASKEKGKDGKPELQIIISYNQPEKSKKSYRERWAIEACFRGLKSSGFNIENTHLNDLERIEKLFTVVMLAFAWAYVVGVHINDNIKAIRICKHGNKAKSFLKCGLEHIATLLLNPLAKSEFDIFKFLSCT
ncbi:MAG: IS4 family transposase [Tannerella sp.]|jgi:hypothetical protein|nr:IS4 family transposase [Tannerella sp.]